MAMDELIDGHVSLTQCRKAVAALATHAAKIAKQKEEKELLQGKEENIWLVLSTKKTTPEKNLKPHRVPLAHPIVDPRVTPVCLITKDPQREYKDLLENHNIKFINRVVGVTKLKGKFRPFEARRMLMKENGLFLADERVVPLLPRLLGKIFFDAKKQPIPVSLTKKDLKSELEKAVSSSYMHQNQGTCTSIKIGTVSQSPAHIVDNLQTALPAIAKRIDGGWDNVQSFHVKTNSSVSLPLWSCKLDSDGRWKGATAAEVKTGSKEDGRKEAEDEEAEESESRSSAEDEAPAPLKKGKKRGAPEGSKPKNKKVKIREDEPTTESQTERKKTPKTSLKTRSDVHDGLPFKSKAKAKDKDEGAPEGPSVVEKKSKASKAAPILSASSTKKKDEGTPAPSKSTHNPDELRKKRAADAGEKKKEKVVKGKTAGSVKEKVLGKKAKSRI